MIFLFGCTSNQETVPASVDNQSFVDQTETNFSETDIPEETITNCQGNSTDEMDLCYIRKAVNEMDQSLCENINGEFQKDVCYMQFAAWYNMPELCYEVVIPTEKDLCFFGLAIQTSNTSLCENIRPETEISTDQEVCRKTALAQNTKENIREEDLLNDDQILDVVYMTSGNVDRALVDAMDNGVLIMQKSVPFVEAIKTTDDVNDWMTYYYLNPNPDLTVDAIIELVKSGEMDPFEIPGAFVSGFGYIFKQNEDKISTWIDELDELTEFQRILIWQALWFSDTSGAHAILEDERENAPIIYFDYISELLNEAPPDILKEEITSGYHLDMLWGVFFVTGDEEYIERIISTISWSKEYQDEYDKRVADYNAGIAKELSEEETTILIKYSVGVAAKWSLETNAALHDKVFEICSDRLQQEQGTTREILEEIVASAKSERNNTP